MLYFDFNRMGKDKRYGVVKKMIETGEIVEFSQVFEYIPIRVVADDLNSSSRRISKLKKQPCKLEVGEIHALSELIGLEMDVVYSLSKKQFLSSEASVTKMKKK